MDPVWAALIGYMNDKTVLNVKIGGVVNAGVIAYVENVRGFIQIPCAYAFDDS